VERALLDRRRARPFVERRHRPYLTRVNGPAMGALDRSGEIERLQIAPDRALGNTQMPDEHFEGRITLTSDQLQQSLATSLGQHAQYCSKDFLQPVNILHYHSQTVKILEE